jgi:hypothetical protein
MVKFYFTVILLLLRFDVYVVLASFYGLHLQPNITCWTIDLEWIGFELILACCIDVVWISK